VKLEVLLVDDDPMVIYMHKRLLSKTLPATNFVVASDGKQAIEYLLSHTDTQTQFLILLDINMPIMDGWEFLKNMQTNSIVNRCHVVMVTSSIDRNDKIHATEFSQVIGFYEKPLQYETCLEIKGIEKVSHFFQIS
jgi:CheY-like chemotaxis protein